jgi:hypothetical protein
VKPSSTANLRFQLERAFALFVENKVAIIVLVGSLAAIVEIVRYQAEAPATLEQGTILAFGIYETEYGTESLVRVRTKSGEVTELMAPGPALGNCRKGDAVRLVRRSHSLSVDMRGCSPNRSVD